MATDLKHFLSTKLRSKEMQGDPRRVVAALTHHMHHHNSVYTCFPALVTDLVKCAFGLKISTFNQPPEGMFQMYKRLLLIQKPFMH